MLQIADADISAPMDRARSAKFDFVVRAQHFANRTPARVRRLILATSASLLATLAGPFGTEELTISARLMFWAGVPGFAFLFWELWFALGRRRTWSWKETLSRGLLPMTILVLAMIDLMWRALWEDNLPDHAAVWWRVAAVSLVLILPIILFGRRASPPEPMARFPGTAIDLTAIVAIAAEDHFVRLYLADGTDWLIYGRFADALSHMSRVCGEQINRGIWVADMYRRGAKYENRRWQISVRGSRWLPVSRSRVAHLRDKGWLSRHTGDGVHQ